MYYHYLSMTKYKFDEQETLYTVNMFKALILLTSNFSTSAYIVRLYL